MPENEPAVTFASFAATIARLAVLIDQRSDLAGCLDTLLDDASAGRARFKVGRQLKQYNAARFRAAAHS